jgi:hypothetical protein
MVGLPADNLVSLSSNVQGYVPEQIRRLYGAKFDFKFSVPRGAVRRGRTSFRVDSFLRVTELEEQEAAKMPPCMYLLLFRQCYIFSVQNPECRMKSSFPASRHNSRCRRKQTT